MTLLFSNNAQTTIAGSITNVATSVALAPGTGAEFPNPAAGQTFLGTFNDAATGLLYEIVSCTARATDTLTIVRAQEGTAALSWNAGDIFGNFMTAGTAQAFIQESYYGYAVDTGAANAYVATLSPVATGYLDGMKVRLRIGAGNSSTSTTPTLNVNGLGAVTITRLGGGAMASGDLQAGADHEFTYSSATSTFLCTTLPPFAPGFATFGGSASGTGPFTWTVPPGVTSITAEVIGAGSGGQGGTNAANAGNGGPGGGYARKRMSVTPGSVLNGTVGAGAAGTAQGVSTLAGGASSFNGISATGGPATTASVFNIGGVGSGGDVNFYGQGGMSLVQQSAAAFQGGNGGGAGGIGGGVAGGSSGGVNGSFPGGGGSGAGTSGTNNGGNGANGQVNISWGIS